MIYLPLIRKHLKSEEILDLLETYDMEVVYVFDRIHENTPDEYWTKCPELGLEMCFDAQHLLKTMFLHVTNEEGFTATDLSSSDIEPHVSKSVASRHALQMGIATTEGRATLLDVDRDWIRLVYDGYSIHYEYRAGVLALITIAAT